MRRRKRKNSRKRLITGVVCTVLILVLGCSVLGNGKTVTEIPEALLEFAEKYPEAEDFVNNYPQLKDKEFTINLKREVKKSDIPLFIQWDKRWGYKIYGSTCMGVTGCGPTCISMVVCGLTKTTDWNPYEVAKFSEEQGYYVWGTGTSWSLMTEGARLLGLQAEVGEISAAYIQEHLSSSTPMIASMYPGDFTYTGHFIVLTGIDEEGNVTVNDPNSPQNSAKTWPLETLLPQIRSLWVYSVSE